MAIDYLGKDVVYRTKRFAVKIGRKTSFESLFQAATDSYKCMQYTIRRYIERKSYANRYHHINGEYPNLSRETGSTSIEMLVYRELKDYDYSLSAGCRDQAIRKAKKLCDKKFPSGRLPNLSKEPIIYIPEICLTKLYFNGISDDDYFKQASNMYEIECRLFSDSYKKAHYLSSNVVLRLPAKAGTEERSILDLISKGLYRMCASELRFETKHGSSGKWILYLRYLQPRLHLPKNKPKKVLGVFLSEQVAVYASSRDSYDQFVIDGGEITSYINRLNFSLQSRMLQTQYCGKGRIGHGISKRFQPVEVISTKLKHFKETTNHRYSRAIVDFASNNGYTDIVLQKVSVFNEDGNYPRVMSQWPYCDLTDKIEYKAHGLGITVHYSEDVSIGIRCCRCGNTDPNNRDRGVKNRFKCTKCGAEFTTDWNASQNLSLSVLND